MFFTLLLSLGALFFSSNPSTFFLLSSHFLIFLFFDKAVFPGDFKNIFGNIKLTPYEYFFTYIVFSNFLWVGTSNSNSKS